MCGICGIVGSNRDSDTTKRLVEVMVRTMIHRGPDDEGLYIDASAALAIRRLSVIDVNLGHQPFFSEDGSVVAVCNGELYNYRELKAGLKKNGHSFHSNSDAEILPHIYEEYGADLLGYINGMFGLAIWDRKNKSLLLARDRMGEKPIYWTHQNRMLIFASELKAILAYPTISSLVDTSSLAKYLLHEYVPAPDTIMKNIRKLEAGTCLCFRENRVAIERYWKPKFTEVKIDFNDAVSQLRMRIEKSIGQRLVSDVPLGVFLSGGLDSSALCYFMSRIMDPSKINTYSIAFDEKSFDESSFAKEVARHLGTAHNEKKVTPKELLESLPTVLAMLDEPLADASIIPTLVLSEFARKGITVALGGDGGDELFAGYPTFYADHFANYYKRVPNFFRKNFLESAVRCLPVSFRNMSFDFKVKQFVKGASYAPGLRHSVWQGSFDPSEIKELCEFDVSDVFVDELSLPQNESQSLSYGNSLLRFYQMGYLAEDILTKVDRATMAASLECRAPFLDHELVEFAMSLPFEYKLKGLTTKYILRYALKDCLPKEILNRPKKGFGIPLAKWIVKDLRSMILDSLSQSCIKRGGFFKPSIVSKLLVEHFKKKADHRKKIWTLFMFEQWRSRFG